MKALLVLFAACVPSQDPIGETVFAVDTPDFGYNGTVGPTGHLARTSGSQIELRDPSGSVVWKTPCEGCVTRLVLDADANVYSVRPAMETSVLEKRSARDGELLWSRTVTAPRVTIVLDVTGTIWAVANRLGPIDFGGGAVDGEGTRWGRYAPTDGTFLASGAFEESYRFDSLLLPLPAGGLVGYTGALVASDEFGRTLWRIDDGGDNFVVHADGEVTYVDNHGSRPDVVRVDTQRTERWRRPFANRAALTPIVGGAVVAFRAVGLAGEEAVDATVIERLEADGGISREILSTTDAVFFTGAETDGYRFWVRGNGGIDLHDRTAEATTGGLLVGRHLP